METTLLPQDPITTTYNEVKHVIKWTVNRFKMRFGGDEDDLMSVANDKFIHCYRLLQTNPDEFTCPFTTALSKWIWRGLIDDYRRQTHRGKLRVTYTEDSPEVVDTSPEQFDTDGLLGQLSADAQTVVNMVLDTPDEIARLAEDK